MESFPSQNLHYGILILFTIHGFISATSAASSTNATDRQALLDFKNMITNDPLQIMTSWNDSIHFCNWTGVSCNPSNYRVEILNLESRKVSGSIPPSIGNLTYLTQFNLFYNAFFGPVPQQLGRLRRLQQLNLTYNSLSGKIPSNLTNCKELTIIEASGNKFVGEIPEQLSSLSKLVVLGLGANNLTGTIPSWIGNFSDLLALSLAQNNFHGKIPDELGRLSSLGFFQLYGNYLSGIIPSSIYNISSIYFFSVTQNQLHGKLPSDVGLKFPGLKVFGGAINSFTGSIPDSLGNASALEVIDFAENVLTGTVPRNLQKLHRLYRLNFDDNSLGNRETGDLNFFTSLANCTSLMVLGLARNRFGGELPSSIGNLSTQLVTLTMGENLIHGRIPVGIENLVNLALLGFEGSLLSGNVPGVIGKLQKLEGLYLNYNKFSGSIPFSIGNLTRLNKLFMEGNRFGGSIPPSLGNCKDLQNLNLSSNKLNGSIPKEVTGLSSLSISLVLSNNSLTGTIPYEIGNANHVREIDLSNNKLSGKIPSSLGRCTSLELLHLEGNKFEGEIPESLKDLKGLAELDLSRNNLSGKIPEFLGKLSSLKNLNLSYNDFEGEIPKEGVFSNASAISVIGNEKLCGGIMPKCSNKKKTKSPILAVILATISAIFAIVALCTVIVLCRARNSIKKQANSEDWQAGVSFSKLKRSTDGFSEKNLIGRGSFGSVYKGVLSSEEKVVAVKVLNLQQKGASKSFLRECNALRSVRHRNLLKIITICCAVDDKGNDFKALVFEFMSNGNLDEWLHNEADERGCVKRLSFVQRLNIAIDIASALDYLHHDCGASIAHCDLKPSNVLLDDDMTAHVGDFGLAKFLLQESDQRKADAMSVSLKGSIGYIPPEYGMAGQVSILGDVYSFGILLLEMFTGKRPTDEMFKGDLNIHNYVAMALPEHAMDVIGPIILVAEEESDNSTTEDEIGEKAIIRDTFEEVNRNELEEYLVSVMKIGLSCSSISPGNRMEMKLAVNKLKDVRDTIRDSKKRKKKSDTYLLNSSFSSSLTVAN